MANESGAWPNNSAFTPGAPISAEQMNRIVDSLSRRITGDGVTVRVRTFPGGQILIEGARGGNGGVGTPYTVNPVSALPAIPESGMLEVYWLAAPGGSGDNQIWRTYAGQTLWYPTQKTTNKVGTPAP